MISCSCMQPFEWLLDSTKNVRDSMSHFFHASQCGEQFWAWPLLITEKLFSQPATLFVQPSVRVQILCLPCVFKEKCSGDDPGTIFRERHGSSGCEQVARRPGSGLVHFLEFAVPGVTQDLEKRVWTLMCCRVPQATCCRISEFFW